tara:strand:- start:61 stop:294 length:234 start_codon:yes stop_codon:yes gene_type:complete
MAKTIKTFAEMFKKLQDLMNEENEERVLGATDEDDWDLIREISVHPNKVVLKTEHTIMEFDDEFKIRGRVIKKRRKK